MTKNLTLSKVIEFRNSKISGGSSVITTLSIYRHFLTQMQKNTYVDVEFLRLVPVTIVSAYESFFKVLIATYIDRDDKYLDRAKKITSNKDSIEIDFDILKSIKKNEISMGELFALSLKYSTPETIFKNLNILLFENQSENIHRRLRNLNEYDLKEKNVIVPELKQLKDDFDGHIKAFYDVFELRHSYVHNFSKINEIDYNLVLSLIDKNINLMKGIEKIELEDLYPDNAFTTEDMINQALNEGQNVKGKMEIVFNRYRNNLPDDIRISFEKIVDLWESTVDETSTFFADNFGIPSMARLVLISTKSDLQKHIIEYFNNNSYILPFSDNDEV